MPAINTKDMSKRMLEDLIRAYEKLYDSPLFSDSNEFYKRRIIELKAEINRREL